jgi:DNA-directed RNA polymerase subunit omega
MINKPTVVELLSKAENRYSLVVATAKRARQISQGSKPLTEDQDTSSITLAADEIDEGKIKIYNEEQWKEETKKEEISSESIENEESEVENKQENEENK